MRVLFLLAGILCAAATAAETPAPAAGVASGATTAAAPETAAPAVWIIAGLPGDAKRAEKYQGIVTGLRDTLSGRCRIAAGDVHALFGTGAADAGLPACNRETLFAALDAAARTAAAGRPVWIFFLGHAKSDGNNAVFHIAGPDATFTEMAARLKPAADAAAPVTILAATAASGKFVRLFAGPGRAILAADLPDAKDNEPELPAQLLAELQSPPDAAVQRGGITLAELFAGAKKRLAAWFDENGYVPTEDACLDGNGDGIATRGPYKTDQAAAEKRILPLRPAAENTK